MTPAARSALQVVFIVVMMLGLAYALGPVRLESGATGAGVECGYGPFALAPGFHDVATDEPDDALNNRCQTLAEYRLGYGGAFALAGLLTFVALRVDRPMRWDGQRWRND